MPADRNAGRGRQGTGARSMRPPRSATGSTGPGKSAIPPQYAPAIAGLAAREAAVRALINVLDHGRSLDDAFEEHNTAGATLLDPRDRGLARLITLTTLRRLGEIEAILAEFLERPIDQRKTSVKAILFTGVAQLAFIGIPPHAAIDLAVRQTRAQPEGERWTKLVNAVLRKVAAKGPASLPADEAGARNAPPWLFERWQSAYGKPTARAIAAAHLDEPPLDISATRDAALWATRLGGELLPTGTIRLRAAGRIDQLTGFDEGQWFVQDAAAALPAKLFGPVAGFDVADLCAAPGGKTAELAAAGALVVAVESSFERARRIAENLDRLKLSAEIVVADLFEWQPGRRFPFVLLDAPCSATGTIRRHPDLARTKRPEDVTALAKIQARMLAHAASLVAPGGRLIFCTCSLEPEEGEEQVAPFLSLAPEFQLDPIGLDELPVDPRAITASGLLRSLPFHSPNPGIECGGMDGFFAARFRRNET